MKDQTFAYIDLETTGGSAQRDRIIEVGLILIKNGQEIDRYAQLVNPEQPISSFIQNYTHISNEMVASQPLFGDIADTLKDKLEGCIFVAHNARFDYSFVKNAFQRLGIGFSSTVLCTVKLSRTLYPKFHKHNLDALIERHNLHCDERHRAMGDVLATWEFVQHASKELGEDVVNEAIEHCIKRIELPPQLPSDILDQIPQLPGVYRFFDAHNNLLHMGKNKNLYQRIQSHFGRDNQSAKALQLAEQLHRIEWTETAGELGAVLLEQQQLKEYPDFAHAQSLAPSISYVVHENNQDYQCLRLVDYIDPSVMGEHIGAFTTPRQAAKALAQIAKSYQLCPLLLGLTPDRHSCGEFPNGYCKGACCGQEDSIKYNLRQQDALASLKLKPWPWKGPILIQQKSDFSGLQESHLVQNWTYLHTWTQSGCHDEDDDLNHALTEFLEQPIDWQEKFSLAHYKLFNKWLFDPKQTLKIIPL